LATALVDDRDLDRSTVDPSIRGSVEAYERFLAEMEPKIIATEEPVEHDAYRYCGTLDRRVLLYPTRDAVCVNWRIGVLDIKRGGPAPWHAIQLSAYARCFAGPHARWNLYLGDDGRYRLVERKGRNDWNVFKAALTLYHWREACRTS
jgi:hypothetical protein